MGFNGCMSDVAKSEIEELAQTGIVTILKKNNEWFIHLQRKDKFGFLTAGESEWGQDLDILIGNLLKKVKNS